MMLSKICVLVLCTIYFALAESQDVQLEPFQSMFNKAEGSSLEVKCKSKSSVVWTAEPANAMPPKAVEGATVGDTNISTLKIVNINKSNEGRFRCQESTTNSDSVSFVLNVFVVERQNATFKYKEDTVLECSITDAPGPVTYSWKKGDVDVADIPVEGKQGFKNHNNGSLEIIHPARSFAGMYTCIAEFEDNNEKRIVEVDVPYYASPMVLPFDKSKNLVQGEDLVIICQVLGYPKPNITWMKGNTILGGADSRAAVELADSYDKKPIDNGQLKIKEVEFDDAGEYRCMAMHQQWPNFNSSQPILVRVKDKLAALWPFLGIVVEVIILCTIIFIYEKKRDKDAVIDEKEEEQGDNEARTPDNVRRRGPTNNPRA